MIKHFRKLNLIVIVALIACIILMVYNVMAGVIMFVVTLIAVGITSQSVKDDVEQDEEDYRTITREVARITHDKMYDMPVPMAITTEDGKLLISNRAFERDFGKEMSKKGLDILDKMGVKVDRNKPLDGVFLEMAYHEHDYTLGFDAFDHRGRTLYLLNFVDITKMKQLEVKYHHSQTLLCYIQIDSYDDITEEMTAQDRSVLLGRIDVVLSNWAQRNHTVLQKYDNSHYLAIFNRDALAEMQRDHFHILDEVRELSTKAVPTTLSMGVGVCEDLSDIIKADEVSKSALELALARGGDQCVVRENDKNAFYGGKTEAKEKRTKVKARVKANALREQIISATNIIIMGHQNPDMDCVGAGIGLMGACRRLNRTAKYVLREINPSIQSLMNYLSKDEAYAQAFITPDEVRDYIEEGTLLIVVDTQNRNIVEMPELLDMVSAHVIIDHHRAPDKSVGKTIFSYVEAYASSTCELVTELLQYFDEKDIMQPTEANALMAGMCMDTKMFANKTGVRTFEAAAFLKRKGGDTVIAKTLLQNDIETYASRSEAVTNAEFYDNTIAISLYENHTPNARLIAAQAADELLNIRGIGASFILLKSDEGISISGRSMGEINVQLILEKLGGGGHMTMAGAQVYDTDDLTVVRQRLVDAIEDYKKENEAA